MKFRTILSCFMAACLLVGGTTEINAQKKGARKSTTTRKTGTSSASSASVKKTPITADTFKGSEYKGFLDLGPNADYVFTYVSLDFIKSNELIFNLSGYDESWTYSVANNVLTIKDGSRVMTLTSPDNGTSLKGTFKNPAKNTTLKIFFTKAETGTFDVEAFKQGLENGSYAAYLELFKGRTETNIAIPVTVKYTPDEDDSNSGSFKISSDHKAATAIGVLKGDFTFDGSKMTVKGVENSQNSYEYNKLGKDFIMLNLGNKYLSGYGNTTFYLYLMKK